MSSFNKIVIVGYLGRDPEFRQTPQGTPVCDFSIATTERRKDKDGRTHELTTWFRVSLFGRQAEVANQYLSKGHQVFVEGALSAREWTDKEGATRTSLEVRGTGIQFLSPISEREQPAGAPAIESISSRKASKGKMPLPADEDIPF